jgi:thiamine-phosphate pyrophosphorylase
MRLLVITSSERVENEAEKTNALFNAGMEILHIRKPDFSIEEYIDLLEGIAEKYHPQIKIHEFFSLTERYNLLGIHLNARNPNYCRHAELDSASPAKRGIAGQARNDGFVRKRTITISKSCHSIEELDAIDAYDYVFLSPIFDSISKQGYRSNFSDEILTKASLDGKINQKVIALGGINRETIPIVKKYAFGGVAVLGAITAQAPSTLPEGGGQSPLWGVGGLEVINFLNLKSLL